MHKQKNECQGNELFDGISNNEQTFEKSIQLNESKPMKTSENVRSIYFRDLTN